MEVVIRRGDLAAASTSLIVVARFEDDRGLEDPARAVDRKTRGLIGALLRSGDFGGRFLQTATLHPAAPRARRVLVIGLGARAALTPARLRQAAALAARTARDVGADAMAMPLPSAPGLDEARAAHVVAEGVVLGSHRLTRFRGTPGVPSLGRVEIVTSDARAARALRDAVARGRRWATAACMARDLANTPGNALTPEGLAGAARKIARQSGARARALGISEMKRLGMELVLAVGRGSVHPPRFIVMERDPHGPSPEAKRGASRRASRAPTVVLIGKGITFDTGGISIKPREGMARMKYDMSGAAAVLGVFAALPSLELPFRVVGLVPAAENMPGGRAFKPGDVLRAMDGSTVEITNTDAEGRLVLADALCYARRFDPVAVVDLATLTGSIRIALGTLAAGLFSENEPLARELEAASAASGERLWRMPLWDEYAESLKSDVADIVNSGGPDGGSSVAAALLARFAKGLPWAHLDIASTAWGFTDRPHEPRGPTGFGVRLLLEWLASRA